jgi:hypothetical protein
MALSMTFHDEEVKVLKSDKFVEKSDREALIDLFNATAGIPF